MHSRPNKPYTPSCTSKKLFEEQIEKTAVVGFALLIYNKLLTSIIIVI